eukprot:5310382-Amphidinium_carterae.1
MPSHSILGATVGERAEAESTGIMPHQTKNIWVALFLETLNTRQRMPFGSHCHILRQTADGLVRNRMRYETPRTALLT